MNHAHPHGDSAELAALYVAGAMSAAECAAFETHLDEGCMACATELRRLNSAATALAEFSESLEPDESIKSRLMERIAGTGRSFRRWPRSYPCPCRRAGSGESGGRRAEKIVDPSSE